MSLQMDRLLESAIAKEASDLHLNVGKKPVLRVHGRLAPLETRVLTAEDTHALMKSITPEKVQIRLAEKGGVDFAFSFKDARFRVNVCRAGGDLKLALRRLPSRLLTIEEIGLPRGVVELAQRARGLLLVTGPTGSGKTTTLASLIKFLSEKGGKHIITIEEPTEYKLEHGNGILTQREVPTDTDSFDSALADALREDPDVVVVGEMRTLTTIRTAITAAETGHLVMATLHTSSAAQTMDRIIDVFPDTEKETIRTQLAVSLLGVVCQQLLPRKDRAGQIAAFEFLKVDSAIANLIREKKTNRIDDSIQTGKKQGMQLLDDHLFLLAVQGAIDSQHALEKANNPGALKERLERH